MLTCRSPIVPSNGARISVFSSRASASFTRASSTRSWDRVPLQRLDRTIAVAASFLARAKLLSLRLSFARASASSALKIASSSRKRTASGHCVCGCRALGYNRAPTSRSYIRQASARDWGDRTAALGRHRKANWIIDKTHGPTVQIPRRITKRSVCRSANRVVMKVTVASASIRRRVFRALCTAMDVGAWRRSV